MHNLNHVERIAGCDGVDEDIAMYPDGILGVDRREFILCHEDDQFEGKFVGSKKSEEIGVDSACIQKRVHT